MLRSSWFRLSVAAIAVIGLVAILVNYRSRSDSFDPFDSEPLLSTDVSRRSTDFEYSQLKSGREVFRVVARTSTLTRAGEHQLEEVVLTRFDDEGNPTDWVEGRGAFYRVERKELEFREDVVIHLFDGMRIEADWAGADLDSEIIRIRSGFIFSRGDLKGRGRELDYRILERRLDMAEDLEIIFPTADGSGQATAGRIVYLVDQGRVDLAGRARLWSAGASLSGGAIRLGLNERRVIEEATARETASLSTADQLFSGGQIHVRGAGEEEGEGMLTVSSGFRDGYLVSPATYRLRDGTRTLSAERISARLRRNLDQAPGLESLVAVKDVRLEAPDQGVSEARAERLEAGLAESGQFEEMSLVGSVFVRRSGRGGSREDLRADRLHLSFSDAEVEHALATGKDLLIESTEGPVRRTLAADQVIEIDYRDGLPHRAMAQLNCRATSQGPDEKLELSASSCRADFADGVLEKFGAEGGARVAAQTEEGTRVSTAQRATAEFKGGKVIRVTQNGDFELVIDDSKTRSMVDSEQGIHDLERGVLLVSGAEASALRIFDPPAAPSPRFLIRAKQFEIQSDGSGIVAGGSVESVLAEEGGSTVVTSDKLQVDNSTGWLLYQGSPRLVRDQNLVSGEEIRINRETQELLVQGKVDSSLVDQGSADSEPRQYRVRAEKMQWQSEGAIAYEGKVLLESEELTLKSPRLDVHTGGEEAAGVDRVIATGGVEIAENGRHWTAEKATFYARSGRVVVGD